MEASNLKEIRASFAIQAQNFESSTMHFSKREYLDHIASRVAPQQTDAVLEVAAGTCACGRVLAPFARTVTCLDATPAMLAVGQKEARAEQLDNLVFVKGTAEALPFLDESFDIVISRLAFHHFPDVKQPFQEMARVLKPGGKLVLIDMEAAEEALRAVEDRIETLRDPSHRRNLSEAEILELFAAQALAVETYEKTVFPVSLRNWMDLTKTPEAVQGEITAYMKAELDGGAKTGFSPYWEEGSVFFRQRWAMAIGRKSAAGV